MARPQSAVRVDMAAALAVRPGTVRELAQRTGWAIHHAQWAVRNMVAAGQAAKLYSVRRAGCRRPVPVYGTAPEPVQASGSAWAGMAQVVAAWPRMDAVAAAALPSLSMEGRYEWE